MAVDLCDALGANLCLQCKSAGKEGFFWLVILGLDCLQQTGAMIHLSILHNASYLLVIHNVWFI